MRLSNISEGVVSTSIGKIVDVKNEIATHIASMVTRAGFQLPDVDYVDSTSDDAIVYVNMGGPILMIRIVADDDIQVQIPEDFANVSGIPSYFRFDSVSKVENLLRKLRR